jgi:predicted TIM-barrel fold metal-dependent hydrolase
VEIYDREADRRTFLKAGLQAAAGAIVLTGSTGCGGSDDGKPMPRNWSVSENAEEHEAWLAQVTEEALEPELAICDPHHHMWDRPEFRYMVEELLADGGDHKLVDTVFVECRSGYRQQGPPEMAPVGETEFMEEIAVRCAADPECRTAVATGIVGHVDLRLGDDVAPVLEAHLAASPERFRGIRHACAWHASPMLPPGYMNSPSGLMADPSFRKGIAQLEKLGLSFDSWAYFTQLEELADIARSHPELTIICDHLGGVIGIGPYAGRRDEAFEEWKRAIDELAVHPNVFMKLGGLAMPLSGFGWHERAVPPSSQELAEATAPYYLSCIEAFGVERCMFESNFPVDKVSCSFTVLWNSFKRIVKDFSSDEKTQLFHDTAARAYRIDAGRV